MGALVPAGSIASPEIPLALVAPFGILLGLIAVMPLTPEAGRRFWHRFYPHVSLGLGLFVAGWYLIRLPGGGAEVARTAGEYFSFICLIGSLFVVAGGIHLRVRGEATPWENTAFLAAGALVANLIGTTGAAMVLIRPWIRMNKIRISGYHVMFFIFVIANCGGALTPVGDPPLFLGYLRGVPFFWLLPRVLAPWLATIGAILAVFWVLDRRSFRRAPPAIREEIRAPDTWRLDGARNLVFLLLILGAVFLPERFFVRELVMLGAAALSYRLTPRLVHGENHFSFEPIREVALLFIGIFLTMMPALGYLDRHGREFGFDRPAQYYFASGSLSAVLDNAPTYLTFLELAEATPSIRTTPASAADSGSGPHAGVHAMLADATASRIIVAISLGAVFFGAMTYLGNGPNFMVKSIAEAAGVKVPTFFGYLVKFSLPCLLPILVAIAWLFL